MERPRSLFNDLFIAPTDSGLIQLIRSLPVAVAAFAVDYGSLAVMAKLLNVPDLIAAAIAFILGLTVNYVLSVRWVFSRHNLNNPGLEFVLFAIIGVVGLGLTELLIYGGEHAFHLDVLVAKLGAAFVVYFWNFGARKIFLYK